MNLLKTSVKRPVSVIMIVICVLIMGVVSMRDIPVDLYPEMEMPMLSVSVNYTGVAPQEMESLVTEPLENQIASLSGIKTMTSTTSTGSTSIRIEYESDVDLDEAYTELQSTVAAIRGLPDEAGDPNVRKYDPNSAPIMTLGLLGDDLVELEQEANDILVNFQRIEGVASVDIEGGEQKEIKVTLDPLQLELYGISSSDVESAIRNKNNASTVASVPQGDVSVSVRVDGEYESIEDISNTLIPLSNGNSIKVKDIAVVEEVLTERTSITKVNGSPAVLLSVSKQSNSNTIEISDAVQEEVEKLQEEIGEDFELIVVSDESEFIRTSINSVLISLVAGAFFAIIVLLIFLKSIRATAVIAVSIPIAIITTFIFVRYTNQTFNIITLSGLALGLGMMVDSSIVILENIVKYRKEGLGPKQAAIKGGGELISAVIASTTTTLVVFIPMMFIDSGTITDLFLPLAIMVAFSLIAALIVAMTLVPMVASKLLKSKDHNKLMNEPRWMSFLSHQYSKLLKWSLKFRWIVAIFTIVLTVSSIFFITSLNMTTFPTSEEDSITISAGFEEDTDISIVEEYAVQVEEMLKEYEDDIELQELSIRSSRITVNLDLIDQDERELTNAALQSEIQEKMKEIPGASDSSAQRSRRGVSTSTGDINITLSGSDQKSLTNLAEEVEIVLSSNLNLENVEVPQTSGEPQLTITVDDELAQMYGLSQNQIISQISDNFNETRVTQLREGGYEYNISIGLPDYQTESIAALSSFQLSTQSGNYVPLLSVASIDSTIGPTAITRVDQKNELSVTADIVDGANLAEVTAEVEEAVESISVPSGADISVGGTQEEFDETIIPLLLTVALAIFLVYTVMAVQFESFIYPFIIMFSLPTTTVGVIFGLLITGTDLSFSAMIGVIVLAGIVVNNAIVLVDYINQLKRSGESRNHSIVLAGKSRLRPILMTTLTTVLGMVPMAIGIGEGTEMQQPIGVVVIFGLLVSMFFTLLFVPVMYTIIDDAGQKMRKLFRISEDEEDEEDDIDSQQQMGTTTTITG
ncbi:efflux RND transporter permease subunit [Chengkuizengella axinellae]|uniref:Efflux RND transporter permease subunit n=1 Tax=Chengkuizengella axinellae TaxID=3064388 RepID=A0ABT9IZ64_9BACL|nr:efflux RND transporter permease subunit [Chengkuizengella sp. 2205SS18-9]MDP5274513.1 efflux RND transporter permease subunit [Chengkuizengella sp. 2205SS18-9]